MSCLQQSIQLPHTAQVKEHPKSEHEDELYLSTEAALSRKQEYAKTTKDNPTAFQLSPSTGERQNTG